MDVQPPDGASPGTPSERRSIPELMRSVVDGITQLFRQEVALAKIEVTEAISERAFGIGALVLGGVFIALVVVYLAAAGVAALDLVMPAWASRLLVAGACLALGGIAFLVGRRSIRKAGGVELTKESVKGDLEWAKQQIAS
ncbi:MAG TPA: phage holin family protein [Actinomycetota bacterium]|nr:phage holin family protein [Actinomycetota bacterium]